MNGYRTEPRRRYPPTSSTRHPVDVFSDDSDSSTPQYNQNNGFYPIPTPQSFYSEHHRSGRSSVPAHLLSTQNGTGGIDFNRSHPSGRLLHNDLEFPLNPKEILDSFQRESEAWFNTRAGTISSPLRPDPQLDNWSSNNSNSSPSIKGSPFAQPAWRQLQSAATPTFTSSPAAPGVNGFQSITTDSAANNTGPLSSSRKAGGIDDLLAPYSDTSGPSPKPVYRNPQPYYPYRRPTSALADPFVHSNQANQANGGLGTTKKLDPLRQQNRQSIQPLHIRSPFSSNSGPAEDQPRPTHRTVSEPHSQPAHTLDILSTSLYDPNSPYYSSRQNNSTPRSQNDFINNNNNNSLKPYFSDSEDFLDSSEEMSKTTPNWKNSFAAMRERFGPKERTPDVADDLPFGFDHSFASNGSLTMPRGRGLLKSASHSTIGKIEPSRSSSLLREAVINRRASEAPDFSQNGSTFHRRNSETPEPTAKRPLGNFWIDTVKNRPTSPSIQRVPFNAKMTTAAERLEQLHEPVDTDKSHDFYGNGPSTNGSYGSNTIYRRSTPESAGPRRNQFTDGYSSNISGGSKNNGFSSSSGSTNEPFPSERFVSERKLNGHHPNFSSLDNAVADLKSNTEKLLHDSRGCAKFPLGEFNSTPSGPTKRLGVFTGTRISPPRYIPAGNRLQHSPSPDSLSGESNASLAQLPHPRPKHNLREQLMNAGVAANTYLGPYLGRRSVTPNFPAPTSGSVASRISVFEKRPGTPTLLQLASASTSNEIPEAPRSPLSPRTTVYRTKPVIHVDMGAAEGRTGAVSPEYDNRRVSTVSTSAAFHFPHKREDGFSSNVLKDKKVSFQVPMAG